MKLKRVMAACFLVLFVFGAAACNTKDESQNTEAATEEPSETKKKTNQKKETEPPVALENVEGLDLSLKILSQNLCALDPDNGNSIKERDDRFGALLEDVSPDIVGTQETPADMVNYIYKLDEYEAVGISNWGAHTTRGEWNMILYRKDRFVLMDEDTFWLSGDPVNPSIAAGGTNARTCTWAELFDTYTGRTIIILNTRLDYINEAVRADQVGAMFRRLGKDLGDRMYKCQMYLTCDLNGTEEEEAHTLIYERAFIDTRDITAKDLSEGKGTRHYFGSVEPAIETSFIFHRGNDNVTSYEIIDKSYAANGQSTPGFVSDHYGVLVSFEMANE